MPKAKRLPRRRDGWRNFLGGIGERRVKINGEFYCTFPRAAKSFLGEDDRGIGNGVIIPCNGKTDCRTVDEAYAPRFSIRSKGKTPICVFFYPTPSPDISSGTRGVGVGVVGVVGVPPEGGGVDGVGGGVGVVGGGVGVVGGGVGVVGGGGVSSGISGSGISSGSRGTGGAGGVQSGWMQIMPRYTSPKKLPTALPAASCSGSLAGFV